MMGLNKNRFSKSQAWVRRSSRWPTLAADIFATEKLRETESHCLQWWTHR